MKLEQLKRFTGDRHMQYAYNDDGVVTATNGQSYIKQKSPFKKKGGFDPGLLSKLYDGGEMEWKNNKILLDGSTMKTVSWEPSTTLPPFNSTMEQAPKELLQAMQWVKGVVKPKNFSPILTTVNLEVVDGTMYVAGTDSIVFRKVELNWDGSDMNVNIDIGFVDLLYKTIESFDGVSMSICNNNMFIDYKDGRIVGLTIDGNYPKYRKLLGGEYPHTTTFDVSQLRGVCEKARGLEILTLTIEGNNIKGESDLGKIEKEIEREGRQGKIMVDPNILQEILIDKEKIQCHVKEKIIRVDVNSNSEIYISLQHN